jgi:hypothetical protein
VHVEECCVFSSLVAECSASATPVVAQIEKKNPTNGSFMKTMKFHRCKACWQTEHHCVF